MTFRDALDEIATLRQELAEARAGHERLRAAAFRVVELFDLGHVMAVHAAIGADLRAALREGGGQ